MKSERLIQASGRLGDSPFASALKAWCVVYLFETMERVFASGEEPTAPMNAALDSLASHLESASALGFPRVKGEHAPEPSAPIDVREQTGRHYGKLFRDFSPTSYWDEPKRLLSDRLERNGIEVATIQGKSLVDLGCGGGRYTVAWKLLGVGSAVGVDASSIGISDARCRVAEAEIEGVEFREASVLDLPFQDNSFDIAFSNGVLHHTTDWQRGLREMLRVLKPGGMGWLYLIENPGGLFWETIDILRAVTKGIDSDLARAALQLLGVPANRIYYMLDHVLVPINLRIPSGEIEENLRAAGAVDIRRLTRGTDFDRIEQIHRGEPYASVKFGVGENRYVFSK